MQEFSKNGLLYLDFDTETEVKKKLQLKLLLSLEMDRFILWDAIADEAEKFLKSVAQPVKDVMASVDVLPNIQKNLELDVRRLASSYKAFAKFARKGPSASNESGGSLKIYDLFSNLKLAIDDIYSTANGDRRL